jgi:hypothetical protein
MNDRTEIRFGMDTINALTRHALMQETQIQKTDHGTILRRLDLENTRIHIASFSEAGDSLEQWRMYGDNGKGYAIGLSRSSFESPALGGNFLEKVRYVDPPLEQLKVGGDGEQALVDCLPQSIKNEVATIMSDIHPQSADSMQSASLRLLRVALLIKHAAFANEREVRLSIDDAPPMFSTLSNGVFVPRRIQGLLNSRHSGSAEIDEKNTLIRAIRIGPAHDQELAEHGLKTFLKMHVSNDVRIDRSVAPFRSAL